MVSVINLESGVDRTVRPHSSDFAPSPYTGKDYSTFKGACELLKVIKAAREARGEPCNLRVEHCGNFKGDVVYGIREYNPKPFEPEIVNDVRIDPRREDIDHDRAVQICQFVLRGHPSVTLEQVLNGQRSAAITNARRACIRAIWDRGLTQSKSALGRFFRTDGINVTRAMRYDPRMRKSWARHQNRVAA